MKIYKEHTATFDGISNRACTLTALFYRACLKFGLAPGVTHKFSLSRESSRSMTYTMRHSYYEQDDAR